MLEKEDKKKYTQDWLNQNDRPFQLETDQESTNNFNFNDENKKPSFAEATQANIPEKQNYEDRQQRTFVFYNLGTDEDISDLVIKTLGDYYKKDPKDLIERIKKDTQARSRYVVTFKLHEDYQYLINNGIYINGKTIRGLVHREGERGPVPIRFFCPNLPTYLDKTDVRNLFKGYNLDTIREKLNKTYGIPTGQYHLSFFDVPDEDFFINFNGYDYKVLSISCIKQRNYERQRKQREDVATKEPTPSNKTKPQQRESPQKKSQDTVKESPQKDKEPPVHFTITGAKPKSPSVEKTPRESPPELQTLPKLPEVDPLSLGYGGPNENDFTLALSPAERIKLGSLEAKNGNLTAEEAVLQQELLNRESLMQSVAKKSSPTSNATTPMLVIDEKDETSSIASSCKRRRESDSESNGSRKSHDTIISNLDQSNLDEDLKEKVEENKKSRKKNKKTKQDQQVTIETEKPD